MRFFSKKIRLFFLLFLSIGLFLHLFAKPHLPPPSFYQKWMSEQIREDLLGYGKPILQSEIVAFAQETLEKAAPSGLFLVQIRGTKILFHPLSPTYERYETRRAIFEEFFQNLAKKRNLPSVDFLLNLDDAHDSIDQVPVFAMAKKKSSKATILIPDFEACNYGQVADLEKKCERGIAHFPWEKKAPLIFWRGSSTGFLLELDNYQKLPRFQLVRLSCEHPWIDAQFHQFVQGSPSVYQAMEQDSKPLSHPISIKRHFAYKYLIDIDGNSCTYSRCRWILMSNSVLIKPDSNNIQWYYKALEPYIHYIPVAENLENLEEVYEWLIKHDSKAKKIALASHKLAKAIFSFDSIEKYMEQLLLQYSKQYVEDSKNR